MGIRGDPRPPVPQERAHRRGRSREVPSARGHGRLRRARPNGAAVQPPLPADRQPGELRVDRRGLAGGDAVHGGPPLAARGGDPCRYREGDRRLDGQLRRFAEAAARPSLEGPEPAGQRLRRDRGRHGDQHAPPQPRRGRRRPPPPARAPRRERGGAPRGHPRPRLSDRRLPLRRRGSGGLPHGTRDPAPPGGGRDSGAGWPGRDRHHGDPLRGQQGPAARADRRPRQDQADRRDHGPPGRVGPARNERGPRAPPGRSGRDRPEPPLRAHAARDELRRDQPLHPRREAARPLPERAPRDPPPAPSLDPDASHRLRPPQDRGAAPPPRGVPHRHRPHRRGDQDDPTVEGRGRRGNEPDGEVPALDRAGEGDPRHAPRPSHRARARGGRDREGREGGARAAAEGGPGRPEAARRAHRGGAQRPQGPLRRRPSDPHRPGVHRPHARGPGPGDGRGRARHPRRLRQAPPARPVPVGNGAAAGAWARSRRRRRIS